MTRVLNEIMYVKHLKACLAQGSTGRMILLLFSQTCPSPVIRSIAVSLTDRDLARIPLQFVTTPLGQRTMDAMAALDFGSVLAQVSVRFLTGTDWAGSGVSGEALRAAPAWTGRESRLFSRLDFAPFSPASVFSSLSFKYGSCWCGDGGKDLIFTV